MKTALIFAFILFVLIGIAWVGVSEMNDRNITLQSEIDGLKRENQVERDSLNKALLLTRDSLSIAFETIRIANKETQEARERSQKTIANLQRIIYIKYESDSARLNAIKNLYPTFKPN